MCDHKKCNEAKERSERVTKNILKGIVEEQDREPLHRLVREAITVMNNMPREAWQSLANDEAMVLHGGRMPVPGGNLGLEMLRNLLQSQGPESNSPEDSMLEDGIPTTWKGKGSQKGN